VWMVNVADTPATSRTIAVSVERFTRVTAVSVNMRVVRGSARTKMPVTMKRARKAAKAYQSAPHRPMPATTASVNRHVLRTLIVIRKVVTHARAEPVRHQVFVLITAIALSAGRVTAVNAGRIVVCRSTVVREERSTPVTAVSANTTVVSANVRLTTLVTRVSVRTTASILRSVHQARRVTEESARIPVHWIYTAMREWDMFAKLIPASRINNCPADCE